MNIIKYFLEKIFGFGKKSENLGAISDVPMPTTERVKRPYNRDKFDCQKLLTLISKNEKIQKLKDFTLIERGRSMSTFRTLFTFKIEDTLIRVGMHAKNSKYENLFLFIKDSQSAKKIFGLINNDLLFYNLEETKIWSGNAPRTLILRESSRLYSKTNKEVEIMLEKLSNLFQ